MNNNLVSIITPSYKSKRFISEAINSVLAQTHQNWEMIIVDDCSPDNSNELIEQYLKKDNRIKLIKLKKNNGPAVARNKAIEEAKGRYIAFLDADDIWKPRKLEKQIEFIFTYDLAFSYSSYDLIDENGNHLNTFVTKQEISYHDMLKTCSIGCLTAIYDVRKLGKLYMEDLGHEDYTLWLKIMKKIKITKGILEPLASYRIVSNSVSANKIKSATWQWRIYRDVEKLNLFKSIYYFMHYAFNGVMKYK